MKTMHGDNKFDKLKEWAEGEKITLETCDTNSHVPTIERTNQFLKEQIRCIRMAMSFKRLPRRFIMELVSRATILINSIPKNWRGV